MNIQVMKIPLGKPLEKINKGDAYIRLLELFSSNTKQSNMGQ